MKAIVLTGYTPPDGLQIREVAQPIPKNDQVLIRVYAASVTIEDIAKQSSRNSNSRSSSQPTIPGTNFAGQIEQVGKDVKQFRAGDQVFGFTGFFRRQGAFAEYTCISENGTLALMPSTMTYEEAAAVPDGGLTSLPFLRDKGKVRNGQRVLVYGASGAVGTAAVQIAKYYGARVTGVCSTSNLELVKGLGAGEVIDYTQEDFTKSGQTYDVIFDTVGKISFSHSRDSLTKKGIFLATVPMPDTVLHMFRSRLTGGKKVRFMATGLMPARKKRVDLAFLKEMIEAGQFRAVIDRRYPWEEAAEAFRYVGKKHKKGNVVLMMGE